MMAKTRPTRPVIRVDVKSGDVVWFPSIKEAREKSNLSSIGMKLFTNKPLKGYRSYYEEDWEGSNT
jgi:hypothetical protein